MQDCRVGLSMYGLGRDRRAYTIIPAQSPILFHLSLTIGWSRALNASCSRCTKAVERITPVPKCLPTKKRTLGTRIERNVAVIVGNETARRRVCIRRPVHAYNTRRRRTEERDSKDEYHDEDFLHCSSSIFIFAKRRLGQLSGRIADETARHAFEVLDAV